ncbi:allantoinase AllB [Alkalihalobacillus sp. BA299]|uniref:allantoinase AllB n=1 Tax=Alkalihalobacillus sp. BA299 TaxID=2815938 RepID=UPI001ADC2504|nr:allantoinase AllB [Alkalihalobacillus sp. BA299]
MKQLIIKNGLVYRNRTFQQVDLIVQNNKIESIVQSNVNSNDQIALQVINATGCYVLPGFIDAHVHFNDPGRETWEGFLTGSKAAAAGGITTVFDMPLNSSPSVISSLILKNKKEHVCSRTFIDFGLWGGITAENISNEFELMRMKEAGIVGFKAFLSESGISDFLFLSKDQLKEAMIVCKKLNSLLALHAEDQSLIEHYTSQLQKDQRRDHQAFLNSRPLSAELSAIHHALSLVEETGASVHFVHVSSPEAIELISYYKEKGCNVTVEVCPHYLLFSDHDFLRTGPILKCAPPLRDLDTIEKLWKCIENGWVDTIGTDHSPCPISMREVGNDNIWLSWGGIQGVQFGFPFFIGEAVRRGIPLEKVVPLMTSNVANRFDLRQTKGSIEIDNDADFTIFDPNHSYVVKSSDILFKNQYSPYIDKETRGRVVLTIVRGSIVYDQRRQLKDTLLGKAVCFD